MLWLSLSNKYCFSPILFDGGAVIPVMLFILTDINIMSTKWSVDRATSDDYLTLYQQLVNKGSYEEVMTGSWRQDSAVKTVLNGGFGGYWPLGLLLLTQVG